MKIAEIRSLVLGDLHFVLIETDTGTVGLGQSACWAYPSAVHEVVQAFKPNLLGQDPLRIEHHWHHLYRMGPFRGSVLSGALSAVDIALWDIKGQHYQAPVWELLGGRYRDSLRLHLLIDGPGKDGTEGFLARVRDALDQGFTAIKFFPFQDQYFNVSHARLIEDTVELVGSVRRDVGVDVDILLELGRRLTPHQAVPLIEALTPFHPMFCEDPIQIDSLQSQAEVAERARMPIANGERIHNIWEFRELLSRSSNQYVRPDLGLAGGFTHVKKIAAVAEAFHSAVVPHNAFGPVLTAATAHIGVSVPNFLTLEYTLRDESPTHRAFSTRARRAGGFMFAPDSPGLGVTMDESRVDANDFVNYMAGFIHRVPMREDGSVALSV